jgi:hypothetical protein
MRQSKTAPKHRWKLAPHTGHSSQLFAAIKPDLTSLIERNQLCGTLIRQHGDAIEGNAARLTGTSQTWWLRA